MEMARNPANRRRRIILPDLVRQYLGKPDPCLNEQGFLIVRDHKLHVERSNAYAAGNS